MDQEYIPEREISTVVARLTRIVGGSSVTDVITYELGHVCDVLC